MKKIASSLLMFFTFLVFNVKADSLKITDHTFNDGYSIVRISDNKLFTGLCLDYSIQTPLNTPIEYTIYTANQLVGTDNYEKYLTAAKLASLWNDSSHSREGIQKAIWSVFEPTYTLDSRYTYLLSLNLPQVTNFTVVLPTLGKGSQGYMILNTDPVPEPLTLVTLGSGLAGIATIMRRRKKNNA